MKIFRISLRIFLGLVFIYSGFVKGIDPMGSAIKFTEYFEVFHMAWLGSLALILSFLQSTAELLIGICLLTGLRMKVTAWAALLFMSFFTLLTFYIALVNPVTDCGCFGDALKLSNWQTFYKNIFLIILAVLIFYYRYKYKPFDKVWIEWGLILLFAVLGTSLFISNYRHLPMLDFRPYHVGTHIPSKMIIPDGAPSDVYNTRLYYQKNGTIKEFSLQNYPWRDSTWKWVKTSSDLIKKGYTPPIQGFSITTKNEEDITKQVLADTSYSFLFISYDLSLVRPEIWIKIIDYYHFTQKFHHHFYFLTSVTSDQAYQIKTIYHLPFDFDFSDQTVMKTIVRSNPGLMLLKDGVILGLWHYNDFPQTGFFEGNILSKVITLYNHKIEFGKIILLSTIFLLIIFILMGFKFSH